VAAPDVGVLLPKEDHRSRDFGEKNLHREDGHSQKGKTRGGKRKRMSAIRVDTENL